MEKELDFIKLYEEIYKCLPNRNIQMLLDVCYEIVGVPILVVDILYNVLGNAPKEKTGDPLWDDLISRGGLDTEQIASLYEDGIIQSVDSEKVLISSTGDRVKSSRKFRGSSRSTVSWKGM